MQMVEISASMVKELREKSGAAMMDCKKALVESSGDFDKAFEWLRQKGVASASKKSSRATSEGLVVGSVDPSGKKAVLVEVNCETDFVAKNEEFVALCNKIAESALDANATTVDAVLAAKAKGGSGTVGEMITAAVAKTGENMQVKRVSMLQIESGEGVIGQYLHTLGGKMGALLKLTSDKKVPESGAAVARELAMHIVSTKPTYMSKEEVPADVIAEEKRIESGKADLASKKPEMVEKIVQGRVDKIMAERCFLEQPFVKDPGQLVSQYLGAKSKEMGVELKPVQYSLYILGEE
ncbi:MAG: elongation factor Ts [Cyanobacteria bacterium TGS_CYA1]|nr:elongation factor Ts [Cyanobacteria bacterium TGS_CYA1]MDX2107437.1 translation elongation factor Ts [Candidatus Melainabacteria bacterium]